MSDSRFQTMRHIECVRNYISSCITELLNRAILHDQSKMEFPEVAVFDEFTPKLKDVVYGSEQYKEMTRKMKPAITHHQQNNRHHPEYFPNGIKGMNLIDLLELMCDWKASTMRSKDGDIFRSIEINQERFGYSDDVKAILENTATWIENQSVIHKAHES